jgi:ribonuclease D
MELITKQQDLEALCEAMQGQPFITVDTEFLRDKTYYPKLCLIQVAAPLTEAHAIDPLATGLSLKPLFELMLNENVVKVFHAARQDLEIFYNLTGQIPFPLFDTQVAAMVCGYGDQVGYRNLVEDVCGQRLDKGAQFTDWARRPLSKKQLTYALNDVIYLREIYLHLASELERQDRIKWVLEEMQTLTDPATYQNPPEDSWERIKVRSDKPAVLAVLREICAWREVEAQRRDVPRNRVLRDESLIDIAVHAPRKAEDLAKSRNFSLDLAEGRIGKEILAAVQRGIECKPQDRPRAPARTSFPSDLKPVLEMLKMILRIQCSEHDVAPRLVASAEDLEMLAMDDEADIPALKGWRRKVFGDKALALKRGKIALGLRDGEIIQVDL